MLSIDLPGVTAAVALPPGLVVEVSQTQGINVEVAGQDGAHLGLECELGAPPVFEHRPGSPDAPYLRVRRTNAQDGYVIEVASALDGAPWHEATTLLDDELQGLLS